MKQYLIVKSSHRRCSVRAGVLRNFSKFTGKRLFQSLSIKKDTLAQAFSDEFCEISKNNFFTEHVWATASVLCWFCFTLDFQTSFEYIFTKIFLDILVFSYFLLGDYNFVNIKANMSLSNLYLRTVFNPNS